MFEQLLAVFGRERVAGLRSSLQHVDGERVQLDAVPETSGALPTPDAAPPPVEQHGADHPHGPGAAQQ